jgi:hypothetical protein
MSPCIVSLGCRDLTMTDTEESKFDSTRKKTFRLEKYKSIMTGRQKESIQQATHIITSNNIFHLPNKNIKTSN